MWSLRQQNYLNYPTFAEYFVITRLRLLFVCLKMLTIKFKHKIVFILSFQLFPDVAMLQKIAGSLVGPLLWGPCSAEHARHD